MRTLSRYFLVQALKVFALSALTFLTLGLLFEFFNVITLAGKAGNVSVLDISRYLWFSIPRFTIFAIPLATLISTVAVLSLSAKKRELVAIRSLGGSLRTTGAVFMMLGILWSVATFIISEHVAPDATRKANRISREDIQKKQSKMSILREKIWVKLDQGGLGQIHTARGGSLRGVSLYLLNRGGIQQRIEAESGEWNGQAWILKDVRIYEISDGALNIRREPTYPGQGLPPPDAMKEGQRLPEEMNYSELSRYNSELDKAGIPAHSYHVTMYGKFSFPFISLAMSMLGVSLTMRNRVGGRAGAIVICALLIVAYWASQMLMMSLGYVGRVPPVIAAWLTPAVFLLAGSYLYARIES